MLQRMLFPEIILSFFSTDYIHSNAPLTLTLFFILSLVTRRKDSRNSRKTWVGWTKIGAVLEVTRNGGAVETKNGGPHAGEKPGTMLTAHYKRFLGGAQFYLS